MGKVGRQRKHDDKMKKKLAAKTAKAAKYKALAGTSKKSKRQKVRSGPTPQKHAHMMLNCGNVGCSRCFPGLNRVKIRKGA